MVSQEKNILRKKLIAERLAMDKKDVAEKSRLIIEKLMKSVEWRKIKKLHVYTSLMPTNEISTVNIQSAVNKRWPNIEISTSLAKRDTPFPSERFDLIIVPVLGFDKHNNRLGMGGGWYDRFLAGQRQAKTIGLVYKSACLENIPVEAHDISLDFIITDNKT